MDSLTRRKLLAASAMAAAWLSRPRSLSAAGEDTVDLHVAAGQPLAALPARFLGLGYEISSVAVEGLFRSSNQTYVQLLRTLSTTGVLRIGGNTSDDGALYAPQLAARATAQGTVVNDAVLHDLGGFLDATGWKLIWSLNLGSAREKDRIAEARAVSAAVGEHLLAFEIGNEPDLYPNRHRKPDYSYRDWLKEFDTTRGALRKALGRNVPLAGPDVAGKTQWVTSLAHDQGPRMTLLAEHYYRGGEKDPDTTIAKMLGPDPRLMQMLDTLRQASTGSGVPFRITEVNSFSGGGRPGVSNTLASALWVLEFMYTVAAHGGAGVNIETGLNQLGTISAYSPIVEEPPAQPSVHPEYYGMLAFAQGAKGSLVRTELPAPVPNLAAFATAEPGGRLTVTILNKGTLPLTARVIITGANPAGTASVIRLAGGAGATLAATSQVSLGEAGVDIQGVWQPGTEEFLPVQHGRLMVPVAPASAAIVSLN